MAMDDNRTMSPGNVSLTITTNDNWRAVDNLAYEIESYYLWVILALGFPGNCFSIITILKMSPVRSLTVYIALLAVVDNLAIVNKILIFYLPDNAVQIGGFGCKVLGFFGNFLITYANWILVGFSIERFAAVWFPFTMGKVWSSKKTVMVVVCITVPLVALFLHLFWTMDYLYVARDNKVFCKINEDHLYFMTQWWYWINVAVYAVIPCLLLLTFNVLIICGIRKSMEINRFLNRSSDSERQGRNSSQERQRQITMMLVTSALALVFLTTPRCVMLITAPYLNPPIQSMQGATLYLVDTLAYVMCDSTHALNFYLYSLSARRFRTQFHELICCRKRDVSKESSHYIFLSSRFSRKSTTIAQRSSLKN